MINNARDLFRFLTNLRFSSLRLSGVCKGVCLDQFPAKAVLAVGVLAFLVSSAQAQLADRPARTSEVVSALVEAEKEVGFLLVEPGVSVLQARSASSVVLTLFVIDLSINRPSVELHAGETGDRVGEIGKRAGGFLAVNGGFFADKGEGKLDVVGSLRSSSRVLGTPWASRGGYLLIDKNTIRLVPSGSDISAHVGDYLQSMPLIIEPGGKWAMRKSKGILKRRTLICAGAQKFDDPGKMIILVVSGVGMSVFDAGWVLRGEEDGGYLGCDAALALDGGSSTQSWFLDEPSFSLRGGKPVHNALVFRAR